MIIKQFNKLMPEILIYKVLLNVLLLLNAKCLAKATTELF